jgi:hypothetical protein
MNYLHEIPPQLSRAISESYLIEESASSHINSMYCICFSRRETKISWANFFEAFISHSRRSGVFEWAQSTLNVNVQSFGKRNPRGWRERSPERASRMSSGLAALRHVGSVQTSHKRCCRLGAGNSRMISREIPMIFSVCNFHAWGARSNKARSVTGE